MSVLQSPPPLCLWYRWIDTEQPEWAVRDVEERHRRAWESFFGEQRREEAEAKEKANRDTRMLQRREEQRQRMEAREAAEQRRKEAREADREAREADREIKKERARQAQAAEEAGCSKGKWPRWTQDN